MKNALLILRLSTFLIAFLPFTSTAQSISGNLSAGKAKTSLGYGNVDIFKGDKLIASVLTDDEGNFNVALDTGLYRCEISYSGYEKIVKEIRVKSNEKADFAMEEDEKHPKPFAKAGSGRAKPELSEVITNRKDVKSSSTTSTLRSGAIATPTDLDRRETIEYDATYSTSESPSMALYDIAGGSGFAQQGRSGALTAGEINDFSKWKLWPDALESDLKQFQLLWKLAPQGRYTLQLQSKKGIPLVNAVVRLKTQSPKSHSGTRYTSRTDNTGKAELWFSGNIIEPPSVEQLAIEVIYEGKTYTIRDAKPFENKINHFVIDVNCDQSNVVDIAFVVDATGSMGDEMSFLTAELNDIVYKSKKISSTLNFRFGNVFYKDLGDEYVTRSMPFSRVLSESVDFISTQTAGGGGDGPEAVEIALDSAINGLQWSDNARARILFLVLDAPPHNSDPIHDKLQALMLQAAEKGIRIVPVAASGIDKSTEYLMRCLALGTNGTYVFLTSNSGIGGSHILPTTDKFDVEVLNDVLIRVIKSYTYMPDCQQQFPDLQLNYPDSLVVYPQHQDSLKPTNPDSLKITWNYYPNPTTGIVNIVCDTDIKELYITDLSGKVIQILNDLQRSQRVQVDLSQYPTGIYLIRYPIDDHWVSGKVVLHHG